MLTATESFVGSLEKWLTAIRSNDLAAAKFHAEHMELHGELLVIHPEFRRAFAAQWSDADPDDALQQLTRFLMCATEIRERAMKEQRTAVQTPVNGVAAEMAAQTQGGPRQHRG